jgi:restriction system protein
MLYSEVSMPIPDFQTAMLPVLSAFNNGAQSVAEVLPDLQRVFGVTDQEAEELLPSGRVTTLQSRAHWARTYLSKAGLLSSPSRNRHVITDAGKRLLSTAPARIDMKTLEQFPAYLAWREKEQSSATTPQKSPVVDVSSISETPDERMNRDFSIIESSLTEDLLGAVQTMTPARFERLILDLLTKMGYGAGDLANSQMTKTSGDGGIDGIINEDALGLDAVYIQAKRYAPDRPVGRPALQAFVGSLTGEGANKGVFVTTSDFSREAKDYLNKVQHRIVLINGERLARLMIQHEVGVRALKTYVLRSVDEGYFNDL